MHTLIQNRTTHLRPVVDGVRYSMHCRRMATYEVSAEVYPRQLVQFCCQISNLSDVVADGD